MPECADEGGLPPIEFSIWCPWKNRSKIPNNDFAGVYLLARFEELTVLKQAMESAPAKKKGPLNGAWVKFVERRLLLDFCMKWGQLADCNKE